MTDFDPTRPLAGIRIIECSMLGPAGVTGPFADMGADVIKIEPPNGDYARNMTWPIVEGTSLLFLHSNRGKSSVVLDLRKPEGVEVFLDLVRGADAVVEAMRPGGLERRGLGFEKLLEVNPKIVFLTISGYGLTGPYRDYPSHGIAYDTWAGVINPAVDEDGFTYIPEHVSIGINAGPLYGAFGILAGITQARATGHGCRLEVAQSDAAASIDWLRSETWRAYERPQSEVTGNASDGGRRRAPGTAGMKEGVRYNIYESSDGYVLFMASERAFWKNFAEGVGRRRPVREVARRAVRRPRDRQRRAAPRAEGHLQDEDDAGMARLRRRGQHPDRAGQHPADAHQRSAVQGPPAVDSQGAARRRPCCRSR